MRKLSESGTIQNYLKNNSRSTTREMSEGTRSPPSSPYVDVGWNGDVARSRTPTIATPKAHEATNTNEVPETRTSTSGSWPTVAVTPHDAACQTNQQAISIVGDNITSTHAVIISQYGQILQSVFGCYQRTAVDSYHSLKPIFERWHRIRIEVWLLLRYETYPIFATAFTSLGQNCPCIALKI